MLVEYTSHQTLHIYFCQFFQFSRRSEHESALAKSQQFKLALRRTRATLAEQIERSNVALQTLGTSVISNSRHLFIISSWLPVENSTATLSSAADEVKTFYLLKELQIFLSLCAFHSF
jgi:hypothetical protein